MTDLLAGIGAKLGERWATLLVLPGLVYLAAGATARILGYRHALSLPLLASWADRLAAQPASDNAGAIVTALIGVAAASAVTGLLASVLGQAIEWTWHRPARDPLSRALARRRKARWDRANAALTATLKASAADISPGDVTAPLPPAAAAALNRQNAISVEPPEGPTWIGDRFRALNIRVRRAHGFRLHAAWPRLWLLLPDQPRAEIITAQDAHVAAARLGGWTLLYLLLGIMWWPALLAAAFLGATAWHRARKTAGTLAELVEAAVDLYARDLARRLGADGTDPPPGASGPSITDMIEKRP